LALLVTLVFGPPPASYAASRVTRSGLAVTIETMSPAVLPRRGLVTLSGTITNQGTETWTDVKAYLLTSAVPFTTPAELDAAAATDDGQEPLGASRVTAPGLFAEVGNLAPRASVPYTLTVPRRSLGVGTTPGVYWFGVQVLGTIDGVRDNLADARARTFLPLLPAHPHPTQLALVLPFVEPVHRTRTGTLLDEAGWARSVATDGRLDRLLRLSANATEPITWAVDPAVVDAITSLSDANPAFDFAAPATTGTASPSPSSSASASPSGGGAEPTQGQRDATSWLAEFENQALGHALLALPYGDPDIAAADKNGAARLVTRAETLSLKTMSAAHLTAAPVVVPRSGYLPQRSLDTLTSGTTVLLGTGAVDASGAAATTTATGVTVIGTDTAAASGGPGPTPRLGALAVRQRVLSEAALHAMSTSASTPLVVTMPSRWNPGAGWAQSDFFGGLTQPWLSLVSLAGLDASSPTPTVRYPASARARQVSVANISAARDLVATGGVLSSLLARPGVADRVAKTALLAVSAQDSRRQQAALSQARNTDSALRRLMGRVTLEGPPFVMMSSDQGPIQVTIINGLDVPVRVSVRARTPESDLSVATPAPVTVAPGARAPLRLRATATAIGVHSVTLVAVDAAGNPIGSTTTFNVRTSQVGLVIWVIIGVALVLLFAAITLRVVRRVRRRGEAAGTVHR